MTATAERPIKQPRPLLLGFVLSVIFLLITMWVWNLVPGVRVAANEKDRRECIGSGEGSYHFSVPDHHWVCNDNWHLLFFDAGLPGV